MQFKVWLVNKRVSRGSLIWFVCFLVTHGRTEQSYLSYIAKTFYINTNTGCSGFERNQDCK